MKIAVVGTGISGIALGHYLHQEYADRIDLKLFESSDWIGGHTRTLPVHDGQNQIQVDIGFIVFNRQTYPNFCRLLDQLGVEYHPTQMSFSFNCGQSGLQYRGRDLNGLFAQRRNLLNARFHRMLWDWKRFNAKATELLDSDDHEMTVRRFFHRERFGDYFKNNYFIPMGSAIWSCPAEAFEEFPVRFIAEFYRNHGMLGLKTPDWQVITGGSNEYVKKLVAPFRDKIRLNSAVQSVTRRFDTVEVSLANGEVEEFDHVVFACHSNQALRILGSDASRLEGSTLRSFPYERNSVMLHTDRSLLPTNKRAWACWNYHRCQRSDKATLTYNMNMLQGFRSAKTYMVSLNRDQDIRPETIEHQAIFSHPLFTADRFIAQKRHHRLINVNRTSFCGAYWGNGFHEDGVNSALKVFNVLKEELNAQLHLRRVG